MLTPEIKTNLILKEIGIKRYSLRKKTTDSLNKVLYYYQKGSILALLDKPFENFVENQNYYIFRELLDLMVELDRLDTLEIE